MVKEIKDFFEEGLPNKPQGYADPYYVRMIPKDLSNFIVTSYNRTYSYCVTSFKDDNEFLTLKKVYSDLAETALDISKQFRLINKNDMFNKLLQLPYNDYALLAYTLNSRLKTEVNRMPRLRTNSGEPVRQIDLQPLQPDFFVCSVNELLHSDPTNEAYLHFKSVIKSNSTPDLFEASCNSSDVLFHTVIKMFEDDKKLFNSFHVQILHSDNHPKFLTYYYYRKHAPLFYINLKETLGVSSQNIFDEEDLRKNRTTLGSAFNWLKVFLNERTITDSNNNENRLCKLMKKGCNIPTITEKSNSDYRDAMSDEFNRLANKDKLRSFLSLDYSAFMAINAVNDVEFIKIFDTLFLNYLYNQYTFSIKFTTLLNTYYKLIVPSKNRKELLVAMFILSSQRTPSSKEWMPTDILLSYNTFETTVEINLDLLKPICSELFQLETVRMYSKTSTSNENKTIISDIFKNLNLDALEFKRIYLNNYLNKISVPPMYKTSLGNNCILVNSLHYIDVIEASFKKSRRDYMDKVNELLKIKTSSKSHTLNDMPNKKINLLLYGLFATEDLDFLLDLDYKMENFDTILIEYLNQFILKHKINVKLTGLGNPSISKLKCTEFKIIHSTGIPCVDVNMFTANSYHYFSSLDSSCNNAILVERQSNQSYL